MPRWAARVLTVLVLAAVAVLLGPTAPAGAADCKPAGVPDSPGSGLPGLIDEPMADPSGKTKYGDYGWAGLRWYTCDLGAGPDAANDPVAVLDTSAGNMMMGFATAEGAAMTQLHSWAVDPGTLLDPVDDATASITQTIRDALWNEYAGLFVIVAAGIVIARAHRGNVRDGLHTLTAVVIAAGAVAWLAAGPVEAANTFDDVAADVVGGVDASIAEATGSADLSNEEARGATFNDQVLFPLWCRGSLSNDEAEKKYCDDLYKASAVSSDELGEVEPDDKRDDFNDVANDIEDDDESYYDALQGEKHNRTGQGFLAATLMTIIALIRIPAEILMVAGLLVVRLAVMFGPLFALAAILEGTRAIAIAGLKMLLASVVNVAVFGVIAAVHTGLVAGLVASDAGLIGTLFIVTALTIIIWLISKPFRSPTKLATGQEAGDAIAGLGSVPGNMARSAAGMVGGAALTYLATRAGSKSGVENAEPDTAAPRDEEFTRPPPMVRDPETYRYSSPVHTGPDTPVGDLPAGTSGADQPQLPGGPILGLPAASNEEVDVEKTYVSVRALPSAEEQHGPRSRGYDVDAVDADQTGLYRPGLPPATTDTDAAAASRSGSSDHLRIVDPLEVRHDHTHAQGGDGGYTDTDADEYGVGLDTRGVVADASGPDETRLVEPEYNADGEATYQIFRPDRPGDTPASDYSGRSDEHGSRGGNPS